MNKLQEIKTDWIQEANTYQFRQLAIEPEDIEWLIEQAEKVEKYEKAIETELKGATKILIKKLVEENTNFVAVRFNSAKGMK